MAGTNALFGTKSNQAGSLFKVTSIRRGFTGGGHTGKQSLASKLALAANIPGATMVEIEGMGHDLPAPLYGKVVDAVHANARKARVTA